MTQQEMNTIKSFFAGDRYAMISGCEIISIDTENDGAVCRCVIDPEKHHNAMGKVMGGVYFALADFSFAVATNYKIALGADERGTVSVHSSIQFFRGVASGSLTAHAKRLKVGRSVSFYQVDIVDSSNTAVACVTFTGNR